MNKNMELVGEIFTAPGKAFASLREQPRFLLPLLAIVLSTAGVLVWYYQVIDIEWLLDSTMNSNPRMAQLSEAQRARAMSFMTRNALMFSSLVGAVVATLVLRTVEAGYYSLAGKITNVQLSFKHWFALAWWSGMPHLLGVIAMAIFLATSSSRQIGSDELQLLSLNQLFFHRKMGEPGFTLLSNLTLLHPWVWFVTVVGVRKFSGRSVLFSSVFALLPVAIIYGGWALLQLRQ